MGGDHAPSAIVAGVVDAVKEYNVTVCLVGIQNQVQAELKKFDYPSDRIIVVHAPEVVAMNEPAATSIRKKKHSSIAVGVSLLKEPGYDAFISAGNTGAVVAASTIKLRLIEGVSRPAIGLVLPTLKKFSFLIDVGANSDSKPEHLLQSAIMARVYAREVLDVKEPTVGLLNIGEEASKGGGFEKETYKLLQENVDNFIGNIEANEVFKGKSDCIVCDGFIGNILIKVSAGLMESTGALIKREIKRRPLAMLGAIFMKKSLKDVKKFADYSEYGGAPLLGVDGLVMISHGRSSPKAIKNAIKATIHEIENDILERLKEEVKK